MSTSVPIKSRGSGYGLDADLARKAIEKYDYNMENEAREWIEKITNKSLGNDFGIGLKDGIFLCEVANAIHPNIIKKIEYSKMPFKQMENISKFLKACRKIGVLEYELFETVDLYELKDLGIVLRCIFSLGRAVQKNYPRFNGPKLGIKQSKTSQSEFLKIEKTFIASKSEQTEPLDVSCSNDDVTQDATPPPSNNCKIPPPINTQAPELKKFSRPSSRGHIKSPIVKVRGGGYGMDAELAKKAELRYDHDAEEQAQMWMEEILQEEFPSNFSDSLKDGVLLCRLINSIKANTIKGFKSSKIAFKQMENISLFLQACRQFGVLEFDLFETVDLFEEKDIGIVVRCLHALGRAVQKNFPEFKGPKLGVKESCSNLREFSQKQLMEAQSAVAKLSLGSSETMARTEIRNDSSITFGVVKDAKLVDSNTIPMLNRGSKIERCTIDRSADISFGHDASKRE